MMKRFYAFAVAALTVIASLITNPGQAQEHPKHEFRGVWVASVVNIDWPTRKNLTPEQQREEFRRLARAHHQRGLNALVVQVRPAADAFYDSPYEPWSEWLTGTQGRAPEPYYDPLEFMIAETHALGMEFHAWINPYRAVQNTSAQRISSTHISVTRPDWIVTYGNKKLLNPGLPEVQEYNIKVIMDIVNRYDVDGIHFDDYFYPYPEAGLRFNDDAAFERYGSLHASRDDWRRDNINHFILALRDSITQVKPWVNFGISPFGVWRNKSKDPRGSDTRASLGTYDDLYADVLLWLREGWIDYVAPQLYWDTEFSLASYNVLLPWWAENSYGRHLYIGHAAYRVDSNQGGWRQSNQLLNQKRMNRGTQQVHGSIYFSSKSLTSNLRGVPDNLAKTYYTNPALVPPLLWRNGTPTADPFDLNVAAGASGNLLTWVAPDFQGSTQEPRFYAVYRFSDNEVIGTDRSKNLVAIIPATLTRFTDTTARKGENCTYIVTTINKMRAESRGAEVYLLN
jgi:uncharacterized lipoprotein YddW (UPF0748 family)